MSGHQGTLTGKLVALQVEDLQGCALGEIWNWACMNVSQLADLMCVHLVMLTPDSPLQERSIPVTRPLWSKVTPAGLHAAASTNVIVGSSLSQPSLLLFHVV